jgi:hypothetical protein
VQLPLGEPIMSQATRIKTVSWIRQAKKKKEKIKDKKLKQKKLADSPVQVSQMTAEMQGQKIFLNLELQEH